ncbi:MAG: orotidine-5'-phosphate decarboxylase [Pedobacter sp.]|nr:MAG: orotidine-5'-phosphate decarboxylase [Pedobacter sp.]
MTKSQLIQQILQKRSFLCIGLDPDLDKIPSHLLDFENPILAFNKQIIDATADLCVAYKPNTAFYECYGVKGWETLVATWKYIPETIFTIADAKRGDIGNTSSRYAESFFNEQSSGMSFDSITVAPYMGKDSIRPFLAFENKWAILLGLTSNQGSADFQFLEVGDHYLFEEVLLKSKDWGTSNQMMYVVGATQPEAFLKIRELIPDHFLLVPGVGAQGGSLTEVCKYGLNKEVGLLVNSARNIIYASSGKDFAEKAREEALKLKNEMALILDAVGL